MFDDPLFVRHPGGIEPTARARTLAAPLADVLAGIRRMVDPVGPFDAATLERTFTIATHDYGVSVLLTDAMALLRREAPGVNLRCVTLSYDDVLASFDRGNVDFACGAFMGLAAQRIERMPVFEDRMVGAISVDHPALKDGKVDLHSFVEFPHVSASSGADQRSPVDAALQALGLERRIAMTVFSALAIPAIVASSDLIGVLPQRLANQARKTYSLAMFDLPIEVAPVSFDLLVPVALANMAETRWITSVLRRAANPSSEKKEKAIRPGFVKSPGD